MDSASRRCEVGDTKGYGHTGLLNTYTTLLYHVPKERLTIALLVNRSHVDLGGMLLAQTGRGPVAPRARRGRLTGRGAVPRAKAPAMTGM